MTIPQEHVPRGPLFPFPPTNRSLCLSLDNAALPCIHLHIPLSCAPHIVTTVIFLNLWWVIALTACSCLQMAINYTQNKTKHLQVSLSFDPCLPLQCHRVSPWLGSLHLKDFVVFCLHVDTFFPLHCTGCAFYLKLPSRHACSTLSSRPRCARFIHINVALMLFSLQHNKVGTVRKCQ